MNKCHLFVIVSLLLNNFILDYLYVELLVPAVSEKSTTDNQNSGSSDQRFIEILTALAPVALDFLGNLLGSMYIQI